MDIDREAPALAEGELRIDAPVETVWSVMSDIPGWPGWNADVREVRLEGPLTVGTVFRWRAGTSIVSRLGSVDPPVELAWTGTTLGIRAVHVYRFEASDGGTIARSAESWRGLIPSVLRGYSRRTLARGFEDSLRQLKVEAERRARTG